MAFFTKESLLVTYAYLYLVMEKHGMLDHQVEKPTLASALAMLNSRDMMYPQSRTNRANNGFRKPDLSRKKAFAVFEEKRKQNLWAHEGTQTKHTQGVLAGETAISELSSKDAAATTSTNTRRGNAEKTLMSSQARRETNPNVAKVQPNETKPQQERQSKEAFKDRLKQAKDGPAAKSSQAGQQTMASKLEFPASTEGLNGPKGIAGRRPHDSSSTASSSPIDTTERSSECPGRGPLKVFLETRRGHLEALGQLVGTKGDQEVVLQNLEQDEGVAQARYKKPNEDELGKLFNKYQTKCRKHELRILGQRAYCGDKPTCDESKNTLANSITVQKNFAAEKVFQTNAEIAKKIQEMGKVLGTLVKELREIQEGPGQQCPKASLKVEHMSPVAAQSNYQLTIDDCRTHIIANHLAKCNDELNAIA